MSGCLWTRGQCPDTRFGMALWRCGNIQEGDCSLKTEWKLYIICRKVTFYGFRFFNALDIDEKWVIAHIYLCYFLETVPREGSQKNGKKHEIKGGG